ncbi:MAG: riboflavin biosynthesis protein RibF [Oscillospiraceae bacterium]
MALQTSKQWNFQFTRISEGDITIDITSTDAVINSQTAVAAGLFDGVHLGHRAVIDKAADIARENKDISAAVFTFDTATVTSKGDGLGCILNREDKLSMLEQLGAEYVYSPDFGSFKEYTAERFVREVLHEKMRAKYVVCGTDFRFGKNASGNVETLKALGKECGITVITVPPVSEKNGRKISSSHIRELISDGQIREVNALLGYEYFFTLPVISGNRIGRTIDFPTINQRLGTERILPKFGVYASRAKVGENTYFGVTNIGVKPTVSESGDVLAETYMIGFDGDIYGEKVKLSLAEFIRPEVKFGGIDELKAQINIDVKRVSEYFGI